MQYQEAKKIIFELYKDYGWASLFTRIRFFTAPYKALISYVPQKGTIIDIGSGYGIFSNLLALMFPKLQITAVELDRKKANLTNHGLPNVELIVDDITKISIPPVNCILMIHVLHHLSSYKEQETLLKECFKKLKKKGILLIVEIDRFPAWKYILTQIADHMLYPKDTIYYRFRNDLIRLLKRYKFKIKDVTFNAGTPFSHVLYICRRGNKNQ